MKKELNETEEQNTFKKTRRIDLEEGKSCRTFCGQDPKYNLDIEIDYTKNVPVFPIKTYLKKWGRDKK